MSLSRSLYAFRAAFQRKVGRAALSLAVYYAPDDVMALAMAAAEKGGFQLFKDGQWWAVKRALSTQQE